MTSTLAADAGAQPAEQVTRWATCRKCGGAMKPGIAMKQTVTGLPDFPGDKHCVTLSPGGPGKLISCMKCGACGWSVTAGESPASPIF